MLTILCVHPVFKTPLPNPSLWQGLTIGLLASPDAFVNGGWWHDSRILSATGAGADEEEKRAWKGWWNDKIVELVQLSARQPDALTILLTGRSEKNFAEIVKRIVASKGLEFDMMGLKPAVSPANQKFNSTMHFKQLFLTSLMETYKNAEEIRIYEDRPKHTKGFRDFLAEYNRQQTTAPTRGPLATAEVVQVADVNRYLDPVIEVAEVQRMINHHNSIAAKNSGKGKLRIKKTVFFTSYMLDDKESHQLFKVARAPDATSGKDIMYHGNNILICPRPCPASILEKVGGMGSKMTWQVTDTGCFNDKLWAVRVRPVPAEATYHTDNPVPLIVMALKKGARPVDAGKIDKWTPLDPSDSFTFETTVGERVLLRIEPDDPKEDQYESLFANKQGGKRKHPGDDNRGGGRGGQSRGYHTARGGGGGGGGGRGRGNQNRGGRGGGRGGRNRGRGGYHNYRSLDDVEPKNQQGGYGGNGGVNYDDTYPPLGQHGQQRQASGNQNRPMGGETQNLQNYY